MTNKEEIKFWKKAIKIIKKGYGVHNEKKKIHIDYRCEGCWSGFAISWIDSHIEILKWAEKNNLNL